MRLLPPWDFPGKSTGVACHFLLQGIFLTEGFNARLPQLLHWRVDSLPLNHLGSIYMSYKYIIEHWSEAKLLNRVRLFATSWTVAYQAPLTMGFSRQEYWSGLPFPSPEDLPDPGIEPGSHLAIKKRNLAICKNMGRYWGFHTKMWNLQNETNKI